MPMRQSNRTRTDRHQTEGGVHQVPHLEIAIIRYSSVRVVAQLGIAEGMVKAADSRGSSKFIFRPGASGLFDWLEVMQELLVRTFRARTLSKSIDMGAGSKKAINRETGTGFWRCEGVMTSAEAR